VYRLIEGCAKQLTEGCIY